MADIHIVREHGLGLEQARKLAFRWAEVAEKKLEMDCTYEEGKAHDVVSFKRPGASGELREGKDRFELNARLGMLLGVFKGKIESEIVRNLDELLAHKDPLYAFEAGLARHEAKHEAKHPAKHEKHEKHEAKHAKHAEPHKAAPKTAAKAPAARKAK
ncbi:MAG TPA: polyhydroxyalkanoic acid system family protein [Ramlibacter sp.]